jgi:hypothetical protein
VSGFIRGQMRLGQRPKNESARRRCWMGGAPSPASHQPVHRRRGGDADRAWRLALASGPLVAENTCYDAAHEAAEDFRCKLDREAFPIEAFGAWGQLAEPV